MTVPEIDLRDSSDGALGARIREAIEHTGCFLLRHPLFSEARVATVLAHAREFFALPAEQKQMLAIERSPHFRGYSVMESEADWREQIHFGREEAARTGPPDWEQLRGPNLWPADEAWRRFMLALMDDLESAGREVLRVIAAGFGLPESRFLPDDEVSYPLLKLIHYRGGGGGSLRSGVAPHVDFSWITLVLQDGTGGLEVRLPDGTWIPVPFVPGTLVINTGEILAFATGGRCPATPHRVVSGARSRLSLPFFLNPGLDSRIEPAGDLVRTDFDGSGGLHVHRVFSHPRLQPFVFGAEEWKRKGLGRYCELCCPAASPGISRPVGLPA